MPTNNRFPFTKKRLDSLEIPAKGRKVYWDTRAPKLAIRITERGAKTFYFVTKAEGRTEWVKLGRYGSDLTPEQARTKAKIQDGQFASGRNEAQERRANRAKQAQWSVREAWDDYYAAYLRKRPTEASAQSLKTYWGRHFERWAKRRLSSLTPRIVEQYRDELIGDLAGATVNRVTAVGHAFIAHAIRRHSSGFDGPNPFAGFDKEKEQTRKGTRLTRADAQKLIEAMPAISQSMQDFFMLALLTGRRAGEIKTMRFVDLEIEKGIWTIPHTKAGEVQVAGLSTPAIKILNRRKSDQVSGSADWVFPGSSSAGHMSVYKKAWKQLCQAAGIEGIRVHDLRGSLISFAQELGASTTVVADQAGHKEIATTLKHYTNIDIAAKRAVVELVAEGLFDD